MSIRYKIITIILLLFNSICLSQTQNEIPWPTLAKSPWPMAHKDPQSTGRSAYKGPQHGTSIWKKDYKAGIFAGPIIGANNRLYFGGLGIYVGSAKDKFHCTDLAGNLIWQYTSDSVYCNECSVLAAFNNNLYTGGTDGKLYAFSADGALLWTYNTGSGISSPTNFITINLDTTIYFGTYDGNLYALKPDGKLKWKVKYDSGFFDSAPAIAPDGHTLYMSGIDSNVYALRADGSLKWKYPSNNNSGNPPLVDNQGNIYVYDYNPTGSAVEVVSLNPDATIRWIFTSPDTSKLPLPGAVPTMDNSGNLYFPTFKISNGALACVLYAIDYQGKLRWSLDLPEEERGGVSQPLICDSLGTIYFGSTEGINYYAVSSEGKLLWQIPLNGYQVDNTGAIGEDGTLYLGVHQSALAYPQFGTLIGISDKPTGIKEIRDQQELSFGLQQNYPNPFNPSTTIQYTLSTAGYVILKIHDVLGREIMTLVNKKEMAGDHMVEFNGSTLPSGCYFYSLRYGNIVRVHKMMLLK